MDDLISRKALLEAAEHNVEFQVCPPLTPLRWCMGGGMILDVSNFWIVKLPLDVRFVAVV